jgi:DNA-binding PadR family transcriptional regulator
VSSDHPRHEPLTPAVFHVLLALSEGARHGYAVMQTVEETSGIDMGPGTVYGTIQRLEARGWVQQSEPPRAKGADGRRNYFTLTRQGRRALSDEAVRLERLLRMVRTRGLIPAGEGA